MPKKRAKPKRRLTAVSLFSGCGGFDWGAKQAGIKIIFANDINPHAASAYRSLFPRVKFTLGDIRDIKKFPHADVLIGCYPCTGFSEAARRRNTGLEPRNLRANENNYLYREFLRALSAVNPKFLFVENVRGMLAASEGWFFKQQIRGFRKRGYRVKYKLLNASNFGVPQERKRIFIVGVRKDIKKFEYEFPEPTHGATAKLPFVVLRDALADARGFKDDLRWKKSFHGHYMTRNRKRGWDDLSYTIVADAEHVPLHPRGKPMKNIGIDKWTLQGSYNRRLSWRECIAIQGLPQKMRLSGSLEHKYKVVGNAVPPAFGRALLRPITRRFSKKS